MTDGSSRAWLVLALVVAWSNTARATPTGVPYSGYLTTVDGLPFAGEVDVSVTIYESETGGDVLYGPKTITSVSVTSGLLSFVIADDGGLASVVAGASSLWLDIELDGQKLEPRQEVLAVPYAIHASRAHNANQLGGVDAASYLTPGELAEVAFSGVFTDLIDRPAMLLADGTVALAGPWDLGRQPIANVVLASSASPPDEPDSGQLWWNEASSALLVYDGADWLPVAAGAGGGPATDLACSGCVDAADLAPDATASMLSEVLMSLDLGAFLKVDGTAPLGGPWDLAHNALAHVVLASSSSAPSAPVDGELWWNGASDQLHVYTGATWLRIAPSTTGGAAADLDCSGCVDASDLSLGAMTAILDAVAESGVLALPSDGLADVSNGAITNVIERSWEAAALPVTIGATAEATLEVADPGVLREVTLSYAVTHPFVPELEVRLLPPGDAVGIVLLASGAGAGSQHTATLSTADAGASPLDGLVGDSQHGTWKLVVVDTIPENGNEGVGQITAFGLTLRFLSGVEVAVAGTLAAGKVALTELDVGSSLTVPTTSRSAGYCDGTNTGELWYDPADSTVRLCMGKDETQVFTSTTTLAQRYAHVAFVTSTLYNGNLGGLAGADAKCQARGEAGTASSIAAPGTVWRAILSSGTNAVNAVERLALTTEIKKVDGSVVALGSDDLFDGGLSAPLNLDENGAIVNATAWTGSYQDGTGTNDCAAWTVATSGTDGAQGSTSAVNNTWLYASGTAGSCANTHRLYCISSSPGTPYAATTERGRPPYVCPTSGGACLGRYLGSTGTGPLDLTFMYEREPLQTTFGSVKAYDFSCGVTPTYVGRPSGKSYYSGADCGGLEYAGTNTPYRAVDTLLCHSGSASSTSYASFREAGVCSNSSGSMSLARITSGGTGVRTYDLR